VVLRDSEILAWRHQRRLAYLLISLTISLMIATVYGRFHYLIDTLAGAALAIAVVVAYRYLSSWPGRKTDEMPSHPLPSGSV
jgi:membrane-associated phospholipid phosphatase